jgi:D-serine deaminase-like pyridoxal phosphate-dependent protein
LQSRNIIGKPITHVDTPALLIDIDNLEYNIKYLSDYFKDKPANLRPHYKSHKCNNIAIRQIEAGAIGITCAKLSEAEAAVSGGISKILIANQVVGESKISRLIELAKKAEVIAAIDFIMNTKMLSYSAIAANIKLDVLVELDIGMARCGVQAGTPALDFIKEILEMPGINFRGIQAYEGHAVLLRNILDKQAAMQKSLSMLTDTVRLLEDNGVSIEIISGGGTGTYDISGNNTVMNEIQAGSYALMDWYYKDTKSEFRQALSVLVTILSKPSKDVSIVDVGTKGIGAEFGAPKVLGNENLEVRFPLSEEHTKIFNSEQLGGVGDKVQLIPSHGCTTSNLHREFVVHSRGVVIDLWPIEGSGCLS